MILALDLGNTRIKWWVLANGVVQESGHCDYSGWANCAEQWRGLRFRRVIAASVRRDEINRDVMAALQFVGVAVEWAVSEESVTGLINGYRQPTRLGVDRWLNMRGVPNLADPAFCVISLGTAVTVDLVVKGRHLGGYIAPGYQLFRRSLNQTDGISLVTAEFGSGLLGSDTDTAVNGAFVQMLNGLLVAVFEQSCLQGIQEVPCYVAGGDAALMRSPDKNIIYDSDLLLRGLCRYFDEKFVES